MNIGIITTSLSTGGVERFVLVLYKILSSLGYSVIIFSINNATNFKTDNLKIIYLGEKSYQKPFRLYQLLKKYKINLIIDNRTILPFFKTFIYEILFFRIKKIRIIHSYFIKNYFLSSHFFNRLFFSKYDKIICVSEEICKKVKNEIGLKNIDFIYNPIPEIEIKSKQTIDSQYILYYGRFENKSKDLIFLLNSYAQSQLSKKNIKLLLVGDGADKQIIINHIKNMEMQDFILVKNAESNPFHYVKNAKFVVMTSNYEGFPMTLVESLALGTPVVCTHFQSGPSEIIKNRENGLLVEKNISLFAKTLEEMTDDEELYKKCKANATESVQHLSIENIKKKWQNLLENL